MVWIGVPERGNDKVIRHADISGDGFAKDSGCGYIVPCENSFDWTVSRLEVRQNRRLRHDRLSIDGEVGVPWDVRLI